jgi:hypothetical protein
MHFNNLVDKQSGMDWYTAAGKLEDARLVTRRSTDAPIPSS